jgi:hypothetical protein
MFGFEVASAFVVPAYQYLFKIWSRHLSTEGRESISWKLFLGEDDFFWLSG